MSAHSLEKMIYEILRDGDDLKNPEDKLEWTIKALKGLAIVSLETMKDIRSIKTVIKILTYVMLPSVISLIGAILVLLK